MKTSRRGTTLRAGRLVQRAKKVRVARIPPPPHLGRPHRRARRPAPRLRASERRAVKMLKDGDAAPHGYAWASAGVPNVTVVDCASHHMNVLLCRGAIRRKVLEFVLGCV